MAQPLYEDSVAYADGTPATVDQMSRDVSHFLMWAAEPKLEARKPTGLKVLIFLVVFTGVLYAAQRKIWRDRQSVVSGKGVSVRVNFGGRRLIKKKMI